MSVNYQVVKDFEMKEFRPGEWELTKYTGDHVQDIEIPAEIDGKKIKKIGDKLFLYEFSLRYLRICEGIETIGKEAFSKTKNLITVELPIGLLEIEQMAFFSSGISYINIPKSVKIIDKEAFLSCENLFRVYIEEGCTAKLCRQSFPNGDTGLHFEEMYIPSSVTNIDPMVFGDRGLGTLLLEKEVRDEDGKVVRDAWGRVCTKIETKFFNDDEVSWTYDAPENLVIHCEKGSAAYELAEEHGTKTAPYSEMTYSIEEIIWPNSFDVFETDVVIPKHIKVIKSKAYYGKENLSSITFEKNSQLEIIEDEAFFGSRLQKIEIPKSVKIIGSKLFNGYKGIGKIRVSFENGSQLEEIKADAFSSVSFGNLVFPSTLKKIGEAAFYSCDINCADLSRVKDIDTLPERVFDYASIQQLILPPDGSIKHIGKKAFRNCRGRREFNFYGIKSIDSKAFENTQLKSVVVPRDCNVASDAFDIGYGTVVTRGDIPVPTMTNTSQNSFDLYDVFEKVNGAIDKAKKLFEAFKKK